MTTPPTDNQLLTYDNASSTWKPETKADPTYAIGDLTDVDTTTVAPTDQQTLLWNNTDSERQP